MSKTYSELWKALIKFESFTAALNQQLSRDKNVNI